MDTEREQIRVYNYREREWGVRVFIYFCGFSESERLKRFDFFSIGAGIEEWRETESVRGNFPLFCFVCGFTGRVLVVWGIYEKCHWWEMDLISVVWAFCNLLWVIKGSDVCAVLLVGIFPCLKSYSFHLNLFIQFEKSNF